MPDSLTPTEARNPRSAEIDCASSEEILAIINAEDASVAEAVRQEIPRIARALDAIAERWRRGGRLFYAGAGTSGRIGALDAAECPPTFGSPPERVQAVIAGGPDALLQAIEGAEDRPADGRRDLEAREIGPDDALVGVAASGRTPYVLGAVEWANRIGALTVGLSCSPDSPLGRAARFPITPVVGPEVVTGSTRMKAGTAQKMVLNMLSTGLMIRAGCVLGNLMVNVQVRNEKLARRAERIVREVTGCGPAEARAALQKADQDARLAILVVSRNLDAEDAARLLADSGGNLRAALEADSS